METVPAPVQDDSSGANPSSVKSDDSSPQHESGRGSPPPNCAICLGTCRNKSFTDSCLHQFCFKCLLTWSRVKAECPLCKQNFRSIIHNVQSNHQYEEYMVEQRHTEETIERLDFQSLTSTRRFRYRTTLTLPRHETIAIQQLLLQHYPIVADMFAAPPPEPRDIPARRRRSPAAFRRTVYRHNLWARPLPDFTGRFRDCSPEFYRYNDSQMHRLVPWLNRELHYLLNENVGHIAYVIARILELLPQYHINSSEFREVMQVYFRDRTEHFLHELYCFASTPYDLTGYDRNVQYVVNEVISSTDSDASADSDIVMVSSSGPSEPPPGPSRPPAPVYPQNYIPPRTADNVIPIETISHSDTDDDSSEVMVVGYIKPPQDRTPEVVDLLGSDSDVIVQETTSEEPAQPSEGGEGADGRSVPLVKLILKRHAQDNADSDSDGSYRPPPARRKRRPRADHAASTSQAPRYTPSPSPAPAASPALPASPASPARSPSPAPASRARDSPPSSRTPASSDSSDSDYSSTTSSSSDDRKRRPKKRKYKKKHKDSNSSGGDKRRSKKRKARGNHKEKAVEAEKDKSCKRKSTTGKGVKSSKKPEPSYTPEKEPEVPRDQPSTSSSSFRHKSTKTRKRRRQSRESKRLKSVVNVMHPPKSSAETSSSGTFSSASSSFGSSSSSTDTISSTSSSTSTSSSSTNDNASSSSVVQSNVRSNAEVPSTSCREDANYSDSEDDLPLNLTIQKTYLSL